MAEHGYSGTPLAKKLGIKPGFSLALVGAPEGFEETLDGLEDGARVVRDPKGKAAFEVWVVFVTKRAEVEKKFAAAAGRLSDVSGAGVWMAWPKKASGVATDVTEDVLRALLLPSGMVDNKVCAVDGTWSGLRFVRRKA